MKTFVGTSGWMYSWNAEGTLDWYVQNSGLNAIELNASFYRFPFPNQVKGWSSKGKSLTWVIKVNRLITHTHMLNERAENLYKKFLDLFSPLESSIALYLFQMPPNFSTNLIDRVEAFSRKFNEEKIAFEFRNESWYNFNFEELKFKGVIVSPDSPEISGKAVCKNKTVYLRFHGRSSWYSYNYSRRELSQMAEMAKKCNPERIFAFFNNNHDMLGNARLFRSILGD